MNKNWNLNVPHWKRRNEGLFVWLAYACQVHCKLGLGFIEPSEWLVTILVFRVVFGHMFILLVIGCWVLQAWKQNSGVCRLFWILYFSVTDVMNHVHHHDPPTKALQVFDPINAIMLAESSQTWHEVMYSNFLCRTSFSFYACEFGVVQLVKRPLVARWFESSLALRLHGWSFPGTEDSFQHFTSVELGVGSNFVDSGTSS